jgi:hypothetical protein
MLLRRGMRHAMAAIVSIFVSEDFFTTVGESEGGFVAEACRSHPQNFRLSFSEIVLMDKLIFI